MSWRARESASSTSKRNSRSMAATADLPVAMPPVRPRRSIISPRAGDGLRGFALEVSAAELGSFYRVAHEHGDGHGADAAGNRSERAGSVDRIGVHVTNEHGTLLAKFLKTCREIAQQGVGLFCVGNFICADIDDCGARANPVGLDVAGFAHSRDDDIRPANDAGEVASFGMAGGDGGIGVHKQKRHRFANDVAAAEDDGVGALNLNIVAAQNFHATRRRARDKARAAADEATKAYGMEAVNVFCGINSFENSLRVDLRREGKLNQDTVHRVVVVEVAHKIQHLLGSAGGGRGVHPTCQPELLGGGDFGFYVKLRGRIFADQDSGQTGADAFTGKAGDFTFQLSEDFVADFGSIQYACGHSLFAFLEQEMIAHEKWRLAPGLAGLWPDPPRTGMYDTVTFYPGSDTQTEWAMLRPITFPFLALCLACAAIPAALSAQQPVAADGLGARGLPGTGGLNAVVATSQLEIHVQ